ncbi:MAG: ArsR/SmtB family transcription factor [Ignavibacteria bacterium]
MAGSPEDEIYSVMFSSLKHPVRRKILRMLGEKSMTFMEMVDHLGVSTPHLTYHLESLSELISKTDDGHYRLSSFGQAAVSAMKGVEDVKEVEPKKNRSVTPKWKTLSALLLVLVLLLSGVGAFEFVSMSQLSNSQHLLQIENQRLLSYGLGADKVAGFLQNVTKIDTSNYTLSLLSNTMQWRSDFGGVAEEVIQYSLASSLSNLNVNFRYRNNHFSRYDLDMIESSPIFTQNQPNDVLQNAKYFLSRYKTYSGDSYLTNMTDLLATVSTIGNLNATEGNIKLQITASGDTVTFLFLYTQDGVDYQAKGLQMIFQNNILIMMSDGYFLFTVGNSNLSTSQEQAIKIAQNYVKTLTWNIEGKQVSGFTVVDPPVSVQLVPHTRGNSVALIPYWYIEMSLTQTYAGGYNEVAIGIFADTGEVSDANLLSHGAT